MKKKILGMFVCMLLIATAVPAVESVKQSGITAMAPRSSTQPSSLTNWTQQAKLLAFDGGRLNSFGWSVSLDGNTALVGANRDNDHGRYSGSAYVFTRTGTTWALQQKLTASDNAAFDWYGASVSVSGDTALIGAPQFLEDATGHVYVFTRSGTTWTQQAKFTASDGKTGNFFGCSVSLKGDTALIGAEYDSDNGNSSGSSYVFTRTGTSWTQQAKLTVSDGAAYDLFGGSVSLSGDTALIGATGDDDSGNWSGSTYIFTRTGTSWTQQAKLTVSDGAAYDLFGGSVSLSGDTALIGANGKNSAYVFTRIGTTWTLQQKLTAPDSAAKIQFGGSVSLDGDNALIGAYDDSDNGKYSGSSYLFTRTGTTWTQQQKFLASDGSFPDNFGLYVSLDGDTALIGAPGDGLGSGSVYVFTKGGSGLVIDIKGGLGINVVISNLGTARVSNVTWALQVNGGILGLISKTMNGTIDLPTGGSKTISTGSFFGLGHLTVIARAEDVTMMAGGRQLLILSILK